MDEENLRTRLAFLKLNSFMKGKKKKIQAEHLMKNEIVLEGPILTCRKSFEAFAFHFFLLRAAGLCGDLYDLLVSLFFRYTCRNFNLVLNSQFEEISKLLYSIMQ